MPTRKNRRKKGKKRGKTRKRGNRGLNLAVGALALSTLGSATASRPTVQGFNKVPTANLTEPSTMSRALAGPSTNYDYNPGSLTFSGPGSFTPTPSFGTAPFSFPQPDTSTAMSAVSPGMNLNPNKNYSVTVKSINNPSFGLAGSIDPLTHHTLEVQEVNKNNEPVGNPAYVGYYAKATPKSVAKYNAKHPGRPKLNAHNIGSIMSPTGVPGHFQTPDAIIDSGLSRGQKLKTVGKPKIVSGKKFNQEIGNSVNLDVRGKYSAPQGAIKGFLQNVVGNNAANSICGAGNCRSEAADVMSKFGGKRRKKRKTMRKRKTRRRKGKRRRSRKRGR
uniref:Uncharacterized protein n=1 Tax=viral metagenome TaxID=1070528 RepID=A0A6C0KBB6_9ZZZZ